MGGVWYGGVEVNGIARLEHVLLLAENKRATPADHEVEFLAGMAERLHRARRRRHVDNQRLHQLGVLLIREELHQRATTTAKPGPSPRARATKDQLQRLLLLFEEGRNRSCKDFREFFQGRERHRRL